MKNYIILTISIFSIIFMTNNFAIASNEFSGKNVRKIYLWKHMNKDKFLKKIHLLKNDQLYKFVFSHDGEVSYIVISATGEKRPNHETLLDQDTALSAGYIKIDVQSKSVYLNNRSGFVCPDFKSLIQVSHFFNRIFNWSKIVLENTPNVKKCSK